MIDLGICEKSTMDGPELSLLQIQTEEGGFRGK